MRSAEAGSPGRFAFRILSFFTGGASSEIAHPNSGRAARGNTRTHSAVRRRPAHNTASAPGTPGPRIREPRLACRFRLRPLRADGPTRCLLRRRPENLQAPPPRAPLSSLRHRSFPQFHVRLQGSPLSFRRHAYKTPARAQRCFHGALNDRRLRFSPAFFRRLKTKAPRPQQGAFPYIFLVRLRRELVG
jgi:hypothetical protein